MTRILLTSTAVFALMSGVALAQDYPASPSAPTQLAPVAPAPPVSSYSTNHTEKSIDANGVQTEQSQSYSVGADGVKSMKNSQTIAPDGSEISATHEERSATPAGQSSTTTTRTTTTTTEP